MTRKNIVIILGLAVVFFSQGFNNASRASTQYWNTNGDFNIEEYDIEGPNTCITEAPWGNNSWTINAENFVNEPWTVEYYHFLLENDRLYLYAKNTGDDFGLIRVFQGDVFNGHHCDSTPIPGNIPEPLSIDKNNLSIKIDFLQNINNLLTSVQPNNSWIMFGINVWLTSELLSDPDKLVLDLVLHHESNYGELNNFKDEFAYHYQVLIGETKANTWKTFDIDLNYYIDLALSHWSLANIKDSLKINQLEFVIEVKNAEASAQIDNFNLLYSDSNVPYCENLTLDDEFGIYIPDLQYNDTHYKFKLEYYFNANDPDGLYWKLVSESLTITSEE